MNLRAWACLLVVILGPDPGLVAIDGLQTVPSIPEVRPPPLSPPATVGSRTQSHQLVVREAPPQGPGVLASLAGQGYRR